MGLSVFITSLQDNRLESQGEVRFNSLLQVEGFRAKYP